MIEICPLAPKLIVTYVRHAIEEEKVDVSKDGLKALVLLSNGDM